MIVIQNNFCDETYLSKIDKFIKNNSSHFIDEKNENYFNVYDNRKNINNSFLNYTEVDFHIEFLKSKFPEYLNRIKFSECDIKCVINKQIQSAFIKPHVDGTLYTHLLYLNDNYEGGDIIFLGNKKQNNEKRTEIIKITPERNLSLLTSGNYFHKVYPIITGEKYTLTTFIRKKTGYSSHNIKQFI